MRNFEEDWETDDDSANERAYAWDVVKTGFRFIVFTCLLYTLIIWGFSNLLDKSNILSGSVSWQQAGIMSFGLIFLRIWNKTFFK